MGLVSNTEGQVGGLAGREVTSTVGSRWIYDEVPYDLDGTSSVEH